MNNPSSGQEFRLPETEHYRVLRLQIIDELLERPELRRYRKRSMKGNPFIPPKHWANLGIEPLIASVIRQAEDNDGDEILDPAALADRIVRLAVPSARSTESA